MIVVTGGGRGLGRAIVDRLRSHGQRVISLNRTDAGEGADSVACDVTDPASLKAIARDLRKQGEPVTALIAAAGTASMNLALTTPPKTAQALVNTNLLGTIYSCQAFAPLMIRQKAGRIITFSTIAVPLALEGEAVYAASKAGVEAFTRTFARDLAPAGLTVNCIAPGPIRTDLLKGVSDQQIDAILAQQMDKTPATPDDIADCVDLLLSDKARALTGQIMHVKGV